MASNILSTNITIEDGIIYVQSTDDKEKKHKVVFDAGGMPYCDCFNWKENLLPCKHMFAVIIHCKEYSWESLPEQYRNSSYFTLDPSCSLQKNSILKEEQKEENSEEDIPDILSDFNNKKEEEEQSVISPPLPKSVSCKTLGSECRDLLDQIKSLTYTCQNDDALTVLQQQLLVSLKREFKERKWPCCRKYQRRAEKYDKEKKSSGERNRYPSNVAIATKTPETHKSWHSSRRKTKKCKPISGHSHRKNR
eukprot:Seg8559.2 transcript_id=Seg8559.2/GoldUCD/mRNA.D3Y31 product="hypothetical protein" pseudo=true protein_id=Seg8559.2/GoldUCD/D3Y31